MSDKWLGELEEQVRAAAGQLRTLKKENAELKKRLAALEKGKGRGKRRGSKRAAAGGDDWARERDEIRRRVEKLTERLESLL